jgi:heme/copper-type cytochrome/quinol oxidase subunit 2
LRGRRPIWRHWGRVTWRAGGHWAWAAAWTRRATTLQPRAAFAQLSHDLFLQILWWDTGIFLVVGAVLAVAIWRFRERDPAVSPHQGAGDFRLELAWTVAPALILAVIAFPTIRGGSWRGHRMPDHGDRSPDPLLTTRVSDRMRW